MKRVKLFVTVVGVILLSATLNNVFGVDPEINRIIVKADCTNPQGVKTGTHNTCDPGQSSCIATTCAAPPSFN